jgi:electron transfer flavoprotein alpha/beta subunit
MPVRKTVERRLEIGMGTIEGPLPEVIATLQQLLEQHGPRARLEVDYGYDTSDQLVLVYMDQETEEEYDARMQERKKMKAQKLKREQTAWNTYLKLKQRFEGQETDV